MGQLLDSFGALPPGPRQVAPHDCLPVLLAHLPVTLSLDGQFLGTLSQPRTQFCLSYICTSPSESLVASSQTLYVPENTSVETPLGTVQSVEVAELMTVDYICANARLTVQQTGVNGANVTPEFSVESLK